MTAPKPEAFEVQLATTYAHIRQQLGALPELYRIAHEAGHRQVVGESVGKITSGAVSDPTASIVGDPLAARKTAQAGIRAALENAPGQLVLVESQLNAITQDITKALNRLDPRETFEPVRYPISITQDEHAQAVEAQARRRARGEGVA